MPTSAAQVSANKINARKSTGPITDIGKRNVANNAVKHGLFSRHLILKDEDPLEYQILLEQLQAELRPSGVLEQTLIERIAVCLWRQKRLVRAETAYIELECSLKNIVTGVNQELNLSSLTEADLIEFNDDHYHWCQEVLKEYAAIKDNLTNISNESSPLIYQQLTGDTGTYPKVPEDFVKNLARYCRGQIRQAEQRPLIFEIAKLVRSKRGIPKDKLRDSLSRYQVMLDNELYKAINELRKAQEYRLNELTAIKS